MLLFIMSFTGDNQKILIVVAHIDEAVVFVNSAAPCLAVFYSWE